MAKRTTRTTNEGTSAKETPKETSTPSSESTAYQSGPATADDRSTATMETDTRNESMGSEPSEEEIRMRAYRRYLERGGSHGQDFEDWLEAERELKSTKRK
jgi:DUF2934 family protein